MRRFTLLLSLLVLMVLAAAGCLRGIGPKRLPVDRTAYVEAIGNSWKEQLLYNIVKLRYGDAPTFIDITQIQQSYTLSANTGVDYSHPFRPGERLGFWRAAGSYQTSPSLTYIPVTGEAVQHIHLIPIPSLNLFRALQVGWNPTVIFTYCIRSINKLINNPQINQEMGDFAILWNRLRKENILSITIGPEKEIIKPEKDKDKEENGKEGKKGIKPKIPNPKLDELTDYLLELTSTLVKKQKKAETEGKKLEVAFVNLDPERAVDRKRASGLVEEFKKKLWPKDWDKRIDINEFQIVDGYPPSTITKNDYHKIYVSTRSVMQILFLLSNFVIVPPNHDNFVLEAQDDWFKQLKHFQVHSVPDVLLQPNILEKTNAFVGVRYKGHWFYILDSDLDSKRIFSAMIGIFTMMEPVSKEKPLLTLPVR